MRLLRLRKERPAVVQPSWTRPTDDLWIASVDGEFAGMIEFANGHFVTTDRTGGLIDEFSGIPQAMHAVAMQRPA